MFNKTAKTQCGQARVWEGKDGASFEERFRPLAPSRRDAPFVRNIRKRNLGAQLVEGEPLQEVRRCRRWAVEKNRLAPIDRKEVEEDFPLRRQQRREARLATAKPFDVVRDQPLKEACPLLAPDFEQASTGKDCSLSCHAIAFAELPGLSCRLRAATSCA